MPIIENVNQIEQEVIKLTNRFCLEHLNMEYASLCEKLVKKLCKESSIQFVDGDFELWAASVIHAIGSINFLFDKTFEPTVEAQQIGEFYNLPYEKVTVFADKVTEKLNLQMFDTGFSTQYTLKNNPFDKIKVDESGMLYFDNDLGQEEEEFEYDNIIPGMEPLSRSAFIVRPKQKIVDYFNYIFGEENSLSEIEKLSGVYLISDDIEDFSVENLTNLLNEKYYLKIFKSELLKFCTDEKMWPENLSVQLFNDMMDWRFSPVAFDVV